MAKKAYNAGQSKVNDARNIIRTQSINIFDSKNVITNSASVIFPTFIIMPVSTDDYNPTEDTNRYNFKQLSSYFVQREGKKLENKEDQNKLFEIFYNFYEYYDGVYYLNQI